MQQSISIQLLLLVLIFNKSISDKKYVIKTSKCMIPDIEPFNEEVEHIISPQPYLYCNSSELLTHIEKIDSKTAVLHIKEELLPENASCCYSYVTRNGTEEEPDYGISLSPCQNFDTSVTLLQDTVKVECRNDSHLIYENVHNAVLVNERIRAKFTLNPQKPISVLLVVVDSVSRLNFARTMQQSYQFLKENNFIEMKGYTKVADNTFPNCMAFLTGFDLATSNKVCKPTTIDGLNSCPMIWYDYRNNGYITAYAEDNSPIATFNYMKKGFKDPPTDYYFKPYIDATEILKKKWHNYMPYCTGPETAGERILNAAKDFAVTFKDQPSFGIFWMNTFSHDEVNAPYTMDEKFKNFFSDLKAEGVLDESVVVVLSDHGIRFGEIRATTSGWLEERMPINMISVPKKFQDKFPTEYANLKKNAEQLTSNYDLFMTLQHILTLYGVNHTTTLSQACPKCVSFFQEIPNRGCSGAGIPDEWCTCIGHFQKLKADDNLVKNVTDLVLSKIYLKYRFFGCSNVTLDETLSSSISEPLEAHNNTQYMYVVLKTKPFAIILATVKFKNFEYSSPKFYIRAITNREFCIGEDLSSTLLQ